MVAETAAPGRDLINRRAAAKINLYLHVTGKRADGFHLLDSLIVFVDMGDDLEVAPADDLTLVLEGPFGPELGRAGDDQDNLVIRAARLLQEKRRDHPTAGAPGARVERNPGAIQAILERARRKRADAVRAAAAPSLQRPRDDLDDLIDALEGLDD